MTDTAHPAIERARRRRSATRKSGYRTAKDSREGGGFVAIPWSVLDSPAYQQLSKPAKALLLEVARQYHGDDNGRLLLTVDYLRPRGWKGPGVVSRAKKQLLEAGLIYETVKGHRPNKASWYAVTWQTLDDHPGFDAGAKAGFQRGAYRYVGNGKNAGLSTSPVLEKPAIDTAPVLESAPSSTGEVSMRGQNA